MDIRTIERASFKAVGLESLLEVPEPPKTLWVRGTLPRKDIKKLAVVGSRALTPYGRSACETLIRGLSGYPVSIVSGLALGADACAHRAALTAGLHTIAIPGSGLGYNVLAPQTNLALAKDIERAGGALLSEHPPETHARPEYFPSRNRIMAGLADAVLMIEAGEKSGTLITARLAVEYNRDLLCVPHRIDDVHGKGAHQFLRMGAELVSESAHILEALHIPLEPVLPALPNLKKEELCIYGLLDEPCGKNELVRRSRLSLAVAVTALMTLELKGLIKEEYGVWRRTSLALCTGSSLDHPI